MKNELKEGNKLRTTLYFSIIEGIFAHIYGTIAMVGSSFLVKLLLLLKATPLHFSMLTSIGQISSIFQPLGIAFTQNYINRKKACIYITALGRILTLFLGISLLFSDPHSGIWFTLILLFCSASLLSIGGNLWIAWISDAVPVSFRGRFFSRRNQFILLAGLLSGYIGSFAVDLFDKNTKGIHQKFIEFTGADNFFTLNNQKYFLTALFVFATLIGLLGLVILSKQPDVKFIVVKERLYEKYKKAISDANFRKLLLFVMWWMLATGVGSAFWSPFMLKKLQMSLFEVQLYGSLHIISSLLAYRFWGKFIDNNGNKTSMKICILLGGSNPMFWLLMTPQSHNIIWFEALISGFMWAGTGIVMTNFVLSLSPKGETQVYSGIYGAVGGIVMMISTMLSGLFFPNQINFSKIKLEPEQVLFGLSGILRWTALIPLTYIAEAKSKSLRNLSLILLENIYSLLRLFKLL